MCDAFHMPVPKVVAELFSLASSMEVGLLLVSVMAQCHGPYPVPLAAG